VVWPDSGSIKENKGGGGKPAVVRLFFWADASAKDDLAARWFVRRFGVGCDAGETHPLAINHRNRIARPVGVKDSGGERI